MRVKSGKNVNLGLDEPMIWGFSTKTSPPSGLRAGRSLWHELLVFLAFPSAAILVCTDYLNYSISSIII